MRGNNRIGAFVLGLAGLLAGGCGPMTFVVGGSPANQRLQTTVVEGDGRWFSDRVAIIDVSGILLSTNKPQLIGVGENPVSLLYEKLEEARRDPRVKAAILRLNTPGGTVNASDTAYRLVTRFREQTGKPVVALMMDVAASGGYYVACAADQIVATPTTVTGSIGVIVQTISFKPALSRIGVQAEAITSGPNKDVGSPLSTMTDEHRALLQAIVDDFYHGFVDVVRRSRHGLAADRLAEATDGRVVTGREALSMGLVDRLGDLYDAFAVAKRLAGIEHADLVLYHRPLTYVGSPYASAAWGGSLGSGWPGGTQINLAQFNLAGTFADPGVEFYYLWDPSQP